MKLHHPSTTKLSHQGEWERKEGRKNRRMEPQLSICGGRNYWTVVRPKGVFLQPSTTHLLEGVSL